MNNWYNSPREDKIISDIAVLPEVFDRQTTYPMYDHISLSDRKKNSSSQKLQPCLFPWDLNDSITEMDHCNQSGKKNTCIKC